MATKKTTMHEPTNKEYRFNTMGDILEFITPENIDAFMIDLKAMLLESLKTVELIRTIAPVEVKSANDVVGGLSWIDDGLHENGFKGYRVKDGDQEIEVTVTRKEVPNA